MDPTTITTTRKHVRFDPDIEYEDNGGGGGDKDVNMNVDMEGMEKPIQSSLKTVPPQRKKRHIDERISSMSTATSTTTPTNNNTMNNNNEHSRLKWELTVFEWQEKLFGSVGDGSVDVGIVKEACKHLQPKYYKEILHERSEANNLCGYPLCSTRLTSTSRNSKYKISYKDKTIHDAKFEKMFCCRQCCLASVYLESQLGSEAVYLRDFGRMKSVELVPARMSMEEWEKVKYANVDNNAAEMEVDNTTNERKDANANLVQTYIQTMLSNLPPAPMNLTIRESDSVPIDPIPRALENEVHNDIEMTSKNAFSVEGYVTSMDRMVMFDYGGSNDVEVGEEGITQGMEKLEISTSTKKEEPVVEEDESSGPLIPHSDDTNESSETIHEESQTEEEEEAAAANREPHDDDDEDDDSFGFEFGTDSDEEDDEYGFSEDEDDGTRLPRHPKLKTASSISASSSATTLTGKQTTSLNTNTTTTTNNNTPIPELSSFGKLWTFLEKSLAQESIQYLHDFQRGHYHDSHITTDPTSPPNLSSITSSTSMYPSWTKLRKALTTLEESSPSLSVLQQQLEETTTRNKIFIEHFWNAYQSLIRSNKYYTRYKLEVNTTTSSNSTEENVERARMKQLTEHTITDFLHTFMLRDPKFVVLPSKEMLVLAEFLVSSVMRVYIRNGITLLVLDESEGMLSRPFLAMDEKAFLERLVYGGV